jgi:hypothetical protein
MVEAASKLHTAAARWSAGMGPAAEVVTAGCNALVAGLNTPALRILAGLRDPDYEVYEHLAVAMRELHLPFHPRGSDESWDAVIRAVAVQVLTGDLQPRTAAWEVHAAFGHELPVGARLAELDDEYDTLEYTDRTEYEVDADVLAEAREIVAGLPDPLARLHPYLTLWEQIGEWFAVDDGSLPEVWLMGLSDRGCSAVWQSLLEHAGPLEDRWTLWSAELEDNVRVNEQPDLVQQILVGKLQAFHVVLSGVAIGDVHIPDLGVFISGDVSLDYRMGGEWNPITLGAFAMLLGLLRAQDPGCRLSFEGNADPIQAIDEFLYKINSTSGTNSSRRMNEAPSFS